MSDAPKTASATSYDSSSDERFTEYYAAASESQTTRDRFVSIREKVLWLRGHLGLPVEKLDVADIGCGAGTQARLWASGGHRVCGVDINAPLVGIARERAEKEGLRIRFDVGSASTSSCSRASSSLSASRKDSISCRPISSAQRASTRRPAAIARSSGR
jgi:2-polyprenyl-6-hydroxyphenyl methylase/3-demethylubiquinone-9 3-methyltransferase